LLPDQSAIDQLAIDPGSIARNFFGGVDDAALPTPAVNYRQQNLNRTPATVEVGFICPQFFGFIFRKVNEPGNGLRP
jgi:hypothetical protein